MDSKADYALLLDLDAHPVSGTEGGAGHGGTLAKGKVDSKADYALLLDLDAHPVSVTYPLCIVGQFTVDNVFNLNWPRAELSA